MSAEAHTPASHSPVPAPAGVGHLRGTQPFPAAARVALKDPQLRRNLEHATRAIRDKRAQVVDEVDDWQALRDAGAALKESTMARLPELLEQVEANVIAHGGIVHWAKDANEANAIVAAIVKQHGETDVIKVKSMATQEIGLNEALAAEGISAWETDLAELIVQLGNDSPSHILVPAIHKNRSEIRDIFLQEIDDIDPAISDDPQQLAMAARTHLRRRFLSTKVGISGANFAVAETGTLSVVESEGNGRMCLTLPEVLITVMGIEKVVPTWQDLEVFLQLLPRSATGERMNPYTTFWTGVHDGDGPNEFHLVLLDNGRTATLADEVGRQALHCIRCSACLNVCPVYERTGGHAYGSVYPGPIGAILTPQLTGIEDNPSLPYASTLCGACYDVCPVKINIPEVLVHLRAKKVKASQEKPGPPSGEDAAMATAAWAMSAGHRFSRAQRVVGLGRILARDRGDGRTIRTAPWPFSAWTRYRDAPAPAKQSFRTWWAKTRGRNST
ncbi:MAG: LutB/LldF family L-lactate oxidation iron-sulfur protein [Acidimicrobiia bacterium]